MWGSAVFGLCIESLSDLVTSKEVFPGGTRRKTSFVPVGIEQASLPVSVKTEGTVSI